MKITRLCLKGYKRLLLRNVSYFEIRPESIYQLLIGTNGSGKSSVMRELSPLPAFSGDYVKGGGKIIELEHRNKKFECSSDFTSGNKHSFKVDGVEENIGGTYTVQKELVYRFFGFDDHLHELLTDQIRFTNMSPQQRREWIIRISGGDLSYAMHVFGLLKSKARDMVGVVKHLNLRLAQESSKLPTEQKHAEYVEAVSTLKDELAIMMERKDPSMTDTEKDLSDRIKSNLSYIEELSIAIIEASAERPPFINDRELTKLMDLDEVISGIKSDANTATQLHNHYLAEYQKVAEIVEALEKSNAAGLEDLRNRIRTLQDERSQLLGTLTAFQPIKGSKSVLAATNAIMPDLVEIFSEMPSNENNYYSREIRDEKHRTFENTRSEKERTQVTMGKLEERLVHIENAKQENCPKCGYMWVPGSGQFETQRIHSALEKHNETLQSLNRIHEEAAHYLEEFQKYADYRRRFARLVDTNPMMYPLWDHLLNEQHVTHTPRKALNVFTQWMDDVHTSIRIEDIDENLNTFEAALAKAGEVEGDGHYKDSADTLANNIEKAVVQKETLTKQLKEIQKYRATVSEIINNGIMIENIQKQLKNDLVLISRAIRNETLDRCIREHLSKLSHNEQLLISARAVRDVVNDLQTSLTQAEKDAEIYRILTDELSPTEGLIAEQLKGFIGCLVEQMNGIIKQVWTYDLEIMACGMDDEELDFKFPVSVNHSDKPILDISQTSSSQIDIFNFSFRLVVMLYLEMEDYPLYLDELAPSFDEQHRINLMRLIGDLVDTRKCSQLFMISHYASMHGALSNADVCVMDDRNIIHRPQIYNRHVTIQ